MVLLYQEDENGRTIVDVKLFFFDEKCSQEI